MERGDVVPVRFGKWGGRPHWEMDLRYLGSDEFGDWLGSPAGMPMRRPGWSTQTDAECAFLVPRDADFVASFNGRGVPTAIYVDVTDRPRWDGDTVRAVDLDLDVVKAWDGTVVVDDEDEFAEHQVDLGYPAEVVDAAQRSCDALVAAIAGGVEPWASVGHRWCAEAADLELAPLPAWADRA
ncbi:MAG TPA: DUF402 domain-containing protein [Lapillicoccus sp.]|nr:DUF402 domain-containing protein [Lapillicoccus sp.]